MSTIFESLVSYIKSETENNSYSKERALTYINAIVRDTFKSGVIKVESKFILFDLIDFDGNEYIYWKYCTDSEPCFEHKAIHMVEKAEHRHRSPKKKDNDLIKHIMPLKKPKHQGNKLRISQLNNRGLQMPLAPKRREANWEPNNAIERHNVPANVRDTYTPLQADFLETPNISRQF